MLNGLRAKAFICLPIKAQKQVLAAILAASPEPLPVFTDEDRQVYYQIARQTSVILQNISLLNETRRRLQEVDLLLDFSRRISGLSPYDIIKALYVWKPEGDEKLRMNFNYLKTQFAEVMHTKETILAQGKEAANEDIAGWGDITFD